MRASFSSRDVDNHTAFIRIKTNAPNEDQFIILPVEVEVTSGALPPLWKLSHFQHPLPAPRLIFFTFSSAAPGIYSSTEMLDFGTLRSQGTQSLKKKRHPKVFLWHLLFGLHWSFSLYFTFFYRSSKNAEPAPFKFGNKRRPDYSRCLHRPFEPRQGCAKPHVTPSHIFAFQSVRTTPSNEAVTVDFKAVTLKAGENRYTKVASISFDGE